MLVGPWLAATGREPFRPRSGAALLTRPTGSTDEPTPANVLALADELRDVLATLPERPDAGRPYNDLRLLVTVADRRLAEEYVRAALQHARRLAPQWSPPRPEKPAPSGPSLTDAQRKRREREQYRRGAEIAARWWLEDALANGATQEVAEDEPALIPGARIEAGDLWAQAEEGLLDFDGIPAEDGTVARPAGPSSTRSPTRSSATAAASTAPASTSCPTHPLSPRRNPP